MILTSVMLGTAMIDSVVGTAAAGELTAVELRPLRTDYGATPAAMNDHGVAVGLSVGYQTWRPVRWDRRGRATELPTFGGLGGDAKDINDEGVVVGSTRTGDGPFHAALWTPDGALVDLGSEHPELWSGATAINDRGMVVGHIDGRATLWRPDGRAVLLPVPPSARYSYAEGIADDDTIIGRAQDPAGDLAPIRWDGRGHRLTLFPRNTYLTDVAGRGWVAGASIPEYPQQEHGTVWSPAGRITARSALPGGASSWAAAVNGRGAAVGWSDTGSDQRPVRWDRFGVITELPGPTDTGFVTITDLADDGTAVGHSEGHGPVVRRALRWDRFGHLTELGVLPGTGGGKPIAVNDRGMVLGVAYDGSGHDRGVLWR